jgi:hypothetical protein
MPNGWLRTALIVDILSRMGTWTAKRVIRAELFVLVTVILTWNFLCNPWNIADLAWFDKYQAGEDAAIRLTLERSLERGFWNSCGLLHETETIVYTSECGLNALPPAVLIRVLPVSLDTLMARYAALTALMLALAFTLFAFLMEREFGWFAAAVVLVLVMFSDNMVMSARNVWWVLHLCLWPFVLSWLLYPRVLDGTLSRRVFLLLIGFLVFIRAACGYALITNVIMGATVAPLYYGIKRGQSMKTVAGAIFRVWAVGVAGFGVALFVNVIQTTCLYDSFSDGMRVVYGKAVARSLGPESQLADLNVTGSDAAPPGYPIRIILTGIMSVLAMSHTLGIRLLQTFAAWFALSIPVVLVLLADSPVFRRNGDRGPAALAATLVWSMIGTLTWPILGMGYTYHHGFSCGMAFYITYMPMLFAALGRVVWPKRGASV